jgi:L-ascorbate metabolism protein UlaG (beta-lactamase superfamily)
MSLTKTTKLILIISSSVILVGSAIAIPTSIIYVKNNNTIYFNLLDNAGVMIESKGVRIYVDPVDLPNNYSDLPADAILITHEHGDHYQSTMITMLQKEDTLNVFPAYMSAQVAFFDGLAVVPGDTFLVGHINVTCFYMYTIPPEGYPSGHPIENLYTSYLIDIDGFTFFHAGDSSNIPEYSQLTGLVDVALLPLGPGCQTMTGIDVVFALDVISPDYFIPIHYLLGMDETFCNSHAAAVETAGCELLLMPYFSSTTFKK